MKVALVRAYNLESLWLCLLQNKVEELNERLRQVIDGNAPPFLCVNLKTHMLFTDGLKPIKERYFYYFILYYIILKLLD